MSYRNVDSLRLWNNHSRILSFLTKSTGFIENGFIKWFEFVMKSIMNMHNLSLFLDIHVNGKTFSFATSVPLNTV